LERDLFKTYKSIQVDDILKSEVLFYLTSAYKMEEPVSPDASDDTILYALALTPEQTELPLPFPELSRDLLLLPARMVNEYSIARVCLGARLG